MSQHVLVLFRTQKMQSLELRLSLKPEEQLIATVLSESGAFSFFSDFCPYFYKAGTARNNAFMLLPKRLRHAVCTRWRR